MYNICVVGLGPAGILTLAQIPDEYLASTVVFEPNAVGGEIGTLYGSVIANIPTKIIIDTLRRVPRWKNTQFTHLTKYADEACPVLSDVVKQLRTLIAPVLRAVNFHSQRVKRMDNTLKSWTITTDTGASFEVGKLILCTGAVPKTMDLPIQTIPLHIALNGSQLASYVNSDDSILVFGTSHSGTLVMKNLKNAGVKNVTAIYRTEKPFYFARDGYSEGIKQESAAIADDILAGNYGECTPRLINYTDFAALYRTLHTATAIIYATGFETPKETYHKNGNKKPLVWDCMTGTFKDSPGSIWGFGIAYPQMYKDAEGVCHPDIGFGGFIDAIQRALPAILS